MKNHLPGPFCTRVLHLQGHMRCLAEYGGVWLSKSNQRYICHGKQFWRTQRSTRRTQRLHRPQQSRDVYVHICSGIWRSALLAEHCNLYQNFRDLPLKIKLKGHSCSRKKSVVWWWQTLSRLCDLYGWATSTRKLELSFWITQVCF